MRGELYQLVLIVLGVVIAALFSVFMYKEVYPEYKIYQNTYVELEEFRSTYTGEPPPPFQEGIKQIVLKEKDKGPETIDRCTSCHIAMKFEHFSPTTIAYDINGNMRFDADGFPVKVPNPNYVWTKLDQAIARLRDEATNEELRKQGKESEVKQRLAQADKYESYKTAHVGEHTYDMTKVLQMHPLIGRETRPFEYHPIEEYGCTKCHSGNGRGLTTEKAHGPVFDGDYEVEFMGPVPRFLEEDEENDPAFANVFNHKPGHTLLFQTTPILVGALMEAKCVVCHQTSEGTLESAYMTANQATDRRKEKSNAITTAYADEIGAVITFLELQQSINSDGYNNTLDRLEKEQKNYALPEKKLDAISKQATFLRRNKTDPEKANATINEQLLEMIGSPQLVEKLKQMAAKQKLNEQMVEAFVAENRKEAQATGTLFAKADAVNLEKFLIQHVKDTESSFQQVANDQQAINAMVTDVDLLTRTYQQGQHLYISQACYACHRIAGFARGGVGPDLTEEGEKYPWFIKESIVWPQADLKTSTMPNFKLDHKEVEALMTFLLAQTGESKTSAETQKKVSLQKWEAGKKMPWEEPISPAKLHDLDYAMEVFAVEGCAACHRLKGFESNVGFAVEKGTQEVPFNTLYEEKQWFSRLFPEEIPGSEIVKAIENHKDEIDKRIVDGVREDSIIEKIEAKHPEAVESLYSNFRYASRAKNHEFSELAKNAESPDAKARAEEELKEWKERVRKVLMVYVQEYGLGRLIGPRPNWAGVYRSDEWLITHFQKPSAHVARSIMPVMPFDNTKFYALTYMLDVLGIRNRNEVRKIWEHNGFNPQQAYEIFCSQCHGEYLHGNGPVSEWIYPIPKSLRNADFLRNLTKENAYDSIVHGVKGTPMPPWGETPSDKPMADGIPVISEGEVMRIVDWIFSSLPGGTVIRGAEDVPKWQYQPEDIIKELEREGSKLNPKTPINEPELEEEREADGPGLTSLPTGDNYYAALTPTVVVNAELKASEKGSSANQDQVDAIFDIKTSSAGDEERKSYYIKKKYYTAENLAAGKAFFELNCAACHGREADGSGNRAETMIDAKPRMLTNLDWLDTRDDLRMLRSIKYGVHGTSMIAWGDQTTALKRMQLVMYIRTLSEEAKQRSELLETLYKTFNEAEMTIENLRSTQYPALAKIESQIEKAKKEQENLYTKVKMGQGNSSEAVKVYENRLNLIKRLKQLESIDNTLQELSAEIQKERDNLQELGMAIIALRGQGIDLGTFNKIINLQRNLYEIQGKKLSLTEAPEEKIHEVRDELLKKIDQKVSSLEVEKTTLQGKIRSPETDKEIHDISVRISSFENLKQNTISALAEAKRSRERQRELVEQYDNQLKNVEEQSE